METDKSLIEKFLKNDCTAEEAARVHRYLSDHPGLLNRIYQQDWNEADGETPLYSELPEVMYDVIHEKIHARRTMVLRYMPWVAAAAVLIAVVSLWLHQPATQAPIAAMKVKETRNTVKKQLAAVHWQAEENNTSKHKKVQLPDGTLVLLSPSTVIKFMAETDKRNVMLEGEALFDVAKDKLRPFTVNSGSLSTTALGTSFRVKANPAAVRVQLLTGKVVVRAAKKSLPGWKKDVYLLPGEQMRYDEGSNIVKVINTIKKHPAITAEKIHHSEQQMVFENTALNEVFQKLEQQFKVSIQYRSEELNGLHFSGTIFYSDSLPVILKAISQMNDLLLTNIPDGFCIKKLPEE